MNDAGRKVTLGAIVVGALAVLAMVAITLRGDEPRRAAPTPSASPMATVTSATAIVVTTPAAPRPSAAPSAAPIEAATPSASVDPEDDPGWRIMKPGQVAAGDLFEPDGDQPAKARKLTSYGTITLGVMADAKVKDQEGAITVLRKLGAEIDGLEVGRDEPPHKRAALYSQILRKYREELRDKVEGSVVMRGTAWSLALDPSRDPPDAG